MPRRHPRWALRIGAVALGLFPLARSLPAGATTTSPIAGYSVAESGSSASAQTTFNVPTVTCNTGDFQRIGFRAVVRTTAPASNGAFIGAGCTNGSPVYFVQLQVNGTITDPADPILPGDRVQSSVSITASATNESISDVTQGWTESATGAGAVPVFASVGAGGFACTAGAPPCRPVPQFSNVTFGKSAIDGVSLAQAQRTDFTLGTGTIEAIAGKLIQGGTGFKVSYVSSCSPAPTTGVC